jgi:hypothetical protein
MINLSDSSNSPLIISYISMTFITIPQYSYPSLLNPILITIYESITIETFLTSIPSIFIFTEVSISLPVIAILLLKSIISYHIYSKLNLFLVKQACSLILLVILLS